MQETINLKMSVKKNTPDHGCIVPEQPLSNLTLTGIYVKLTKSNERIALSEQNGSVAAGESSAKPQPTSDRQRSDTMDTKLADFLAVCRECRE